MKPLFSSLKADKQERILEACFREFSALDYEQASLDRIVEAAGISKGGLYEYIESKEDLYLHIVSLVYDRMYAHLGRVSLPEDPLERFWAVSVAAIDFYLDHPRCVSIIVRSGHLSDPSLASRAQGVFEGHFARVFQGASAPGLAFPWERVLELMKWLLAKTRNDFLAGLASGADRAQVRAAYLGEWEFLLAILRNGIYQKERRQPC